MKKIPVVFNCDNAYIMPTCIVIISILENDNVVTNYDFYILLSEKISFESVEIINRLKNRYPRINLKYIEAEDILENAVTNGNHITVSTYLRLFIPRFLPEYQKCIFLDSDIIVNCNLKELFEIDMTGYYIAGVREYELSRNQDAKVNKIKELGIPDVDSYIYAGVMVVNLDLMRKNHMEEEFIKYIEIGYMYQDQDVLNKCCYGKIRYIPLKYNFLNRHIGLQKLLWNSVYPEEEIRETEDENVIIHFPGKNKPWIFPQIKGGEQWWKYADTFLTVEEKKVFEEKAIRHRTNLEWSNVIKACEGYNKIVIWGYSNIGRYVARTLKKNGELTIFAFCDNDLGKVGQEYFGIKVLPVQEILKNKEGLLIINTSQRGYNAINKQLEQLGIDVKDIFTYTHKGQIYYKSLTPNEYQYELREIFYKETGSNEYFDKLEFAQILYDLKNHKGKLESEINEIYNLEEWM